VLLAANLLRLRLSSAANYIIIFVIRDWRFIFIQIEQNKQKPNPENEEGLNLPSINRKTFQILEEYWRSNYEQIKFIIIVRKQFQHLIVYPVMLMDFPGYPDILPFSHVLRKLNKENIVYLLNGELQCSVSKLRSESKKSRFKKFLLEFDIKLIIIVFFKKKKSYRIPTGGN
jgi:hypothetical protein